MLMRKSTLALIMLIGASLLLAGCANDQAEVVEKIVMQTVVVTVEKPVEVVRTVVVEKEVVIEVTATPAPTVLRVNLDTYPGIIDPQKSSFVDEIAHLQLIYEGLTRLDAALATVAGAAESWQYNADATQLVFTLRPDLRYSDGSMLNAERFAYAIKRNINPETEGEYAQVTDEIKGAAEWRSCNTTGDAAACAATKAVVDESVRASHADGAPCTGYEDAACNTLTLAFAKPAPHFHTVMSLWVAYPAKEEAIAEGGEQWWNSSKYQIGNGPYVLQSLEPFVRSYFTPNANYWRGVGKVDIAYAYDADSAAAFAAYQNDEYDIMSPAAEDLETIKADPQLSAELHTYPGSCTYAVMFHQLKEPFTDQKVREAFAYALDREAWVSAVLRGLGSPALSWIPAGYPGYDAAESRWGFDPEAARAALAASSYGSAANLPPIKLTFKDIPRNRTSFEWLAAQWREVLGVEVALDPVDVSAYDALTRDIATTPQTFLQGWCADYPGEQNWLSAYWKTGAFSARIGYSNPAFDALVDQADATIDPVQRADLYVQAQRLLVDGAPVAFMYNDVNNYLVKPWVKGIVQTPQDSGWSGILDPLTIDIDTTLQP